ncbi:MAG TPA: hypothetical protein VI461_12730 [Chitinophagaceae bacterium]|nr:hypothetical protein [Chitinophagaceae bacterium]
MEKIVSLEFSYLSQVYYALIRIHRMDTEQQYHVTFLNEDLQQVLYGQHVIIDEKETSQKTTGLAKEAGALKECVITCLILYLQSKDSPGEDGKFHTQITPGLSLN